MSRRFLVLYHLIFTLAAAYISYKVLKDTSILTIGLLALSFVFHWWIGTLTYLNLPARKNLKPILSYPLYFLIFTAMTTGTFFFFDNNIFLLTYGVSFIFVIPLYRTMLKSGALKNNVIEFVKYKYILEYIGGLGFLATAMSIYLLPQYSNEVLLACLLTHLIILTFLFKPKLYPNVIKSLGIRFI